MPGPEVVEAASPSQEAECLKSRSSEVSELSEADKLVATDALRVSGDFPDVIPRLVEQMRSHGGALWEDAPSVTGIHCDQGALEDFKKHVAEVYSFGVPSEQALDDFDMERFGVERLPNVGEGKHNAHFDPYDSSCHDALMALAEPWLEIIRGLDPSRSWSLFDTAVSITRPMRGASAGEGIEWHTDGAEGTATVLMSLENVTSEQGYLEFAPKSHLLYDEFHADPEAALASPEGSGRALYAYTAGQPLLLDSRTWHRALDNHSNRFRFVAMFYYTSQEEEE